MTSKHRTNNLIYEIFDEHHNNGNLNTKNIRIKQPNKILMGHNNIKFDSSRFHMPEFLMAIEGKTDSPFPANQFQKQTPEVFCKKRCS